MRKIIYTGVVAATIFALALPVRAEEDKVKEPPSLDERFEMCIKDSGCPVRERMQLMDEMAEHMRGEMHEMNQFCLQREYDDCIGPQNDRM